MIHDEPADNIPLSDEYERRVASLEQLRNDGQHPWAAARQVSHTSKQAVESLTPDSLLTEISVAGRLMVRRLHGKGAFAQIQDRSGTLQIYAKLDRLGEKLYHFFSHQLDIGDYVWCRGTMFMTKTGQPTLDIQEIVLLTKCLHALPEKFHGLQDIEIKYRQRYLDLMTSPETRERFKTRSALISSLRAYLDGQDFIEVETPMLHPILGGASARPFITHHNTLDTDLYLRIAPELYLKQLVIGGFERVYEINRNFRNEGISTRHNPEFTMLEFYRTHSNYHEAMLFVQELIRAAVNKAVGKLEVPFGQHIIDFGKPFAQLSPVQALQKYVNITPEKLTEQTIDKVLQEHKIAVPLHSMELGQKIFLLFEELVEHQLIQPTYIVDFPVETSPLARRDDDNQGIAARFELFIAGMEISNGYNELNDPFDQAKRFTQQVKEHAAGNEEAMLYDADYITALEYGLPPTVGVGIGIDRLVMLITNTTSIKEVILFPTLRRK
jgi:lysyl-tRNA synthetase class 2